MQFDGDWIRINENFDVSGDRQTPQFARNLRSPGGMIIGRIMREGTEFMPQVYRGGEFVTIDRFGSWGEAELAIRQNVSRPR